MRWTFVILVAALGACDLTEEHDIGGIDIPLRPPSIAQLDLWRKDEPWRSDPKRVAHEEIQLNVDVPWKGEPFREDRYTFRESNPERAEWGSYVTRGYLDRGGREMRYRVKVSQDRGIWYAREVSRYIKARIEDESGHHH